MKRILVLTDGKAGHENQSKALVRALGCEAYLVPVRFKSAFHKALSYLFDRFGIRTQSLFTFVPGESGLPSCLNRDGKPDGTAVPFEPYAVVGTGSGTFYAAKTLARRLGVKCAVVLYPRGYSLAGFDCILAPSFDRPAKRGNVIEIPANLVANDADFYAAGVADFKAHYVRTTGRAYDPVRRAVAVIVGGPNTCSTLTSAWMKAQLERVFAENPDSELWVTTSRRTPAEVEATVDSFPFGYRLLYSRDHFNPIPAFVKLADRLYVTAESTGMLSEACTCGTAEVFALDNLKPGPHKFRRFVESLTAAGYVAGRRKVDLADQLSRVRAILSGEGADGPQRA